MELTKAERKILMSALGRIGGKARAKVLGKARLREIAAKAGAQFAANCRARKKGLTASQKTA